MKLKGKIIIGAMVLAAISGMQSMAAEKEVYQLGEVLVTANKYSVPDLEIPAATEVISGQQIENMGAKSVIGSHEEYSWLCYFRVIEDQKLLG